MILGSSAFRYTTIAMDMKWLFTFAFLLFTRLLCTGQEIPESNKYPFNIKYLAFAAAGLAENDTLIPVQKKTKYYYINSYTNADVFNRCFDEAYPFYNGYGLVKYNGKYGIIDRTGQFIISPNYNWFNKNGKNPCINFGYIDYFI